MGTLLRNAEKLLNPTDLDVTMSAVIVLSLIQGANNITALNVQVVSVFDLPFSLF